MNAKMTNIIFKVTENRKARIIAHAAELELTSSEFLRRLIDKYFEDRHQQNEQYREAVQRRLNGQ